MPAPIVNDQCNAFFELPHDYSCSECNDPMGIFTCHGCSKVLCQQHAVQHREPLKAKLAYIIHENQKLDVHIDNAAHTKVYETLREDIDEWEVKSIEKIKNAAAEARKRLADIDSGHGNSQLNRVKKCHQVFTDRLEQAEKNNDYHEQHLVYWEQFLKDLEQNYKGLQSSFARIEFCSKQFISKLLVVENPMATRFTQWCYYQKESVPTTALRRSQFFQEDFCSQSCYIGPCKTTIPGNYEPKRESSKISILNSDYTGELQTGEYRFSIDERCQFIGIIAKNENQKGAPLGTRSVYGWCTTENAVYSNGLRQITPSNDLHPGDKVSLIISSDQRSICLQNLTRGQTQELPVDLQKCPLPWQLKIVISASKYP